MSRKKPAKPYLEMTTEELHKATEEFDKEFVADRAQPLSPQMRRRWERAKAKSPRFKSATWRRVKRWTTPRS